MNHGWGVNKVVLAGCLLLAAAVCRAQDADGDSRRVHEAFNLARLSSPLAAWESFHALTDEYCGIIKSEGYTPDNKQHLRTLERQITKMFDLRNVPPSLRETLAVEAAVHLRETLARFRPLQPGMLPGREEAFADMSAGFPPMWSVDDTDIVIVYIDSGTFIGGFQFSERTLFLADEIHALTAHLDYQDPAIEGFHDAYFLTPGPLIPSELIRSLPAWMRLNFAAQSIWQWCLLVAGFLVWGGLLGLMFWGVIRSSESWSPIFKGLIRLGLPLVTMGLTRMLVTLLEDQVFITGNVLAALNYFEAVVEVFAWIMVVFVIGNTFCRLVAARAGETVTIDLQLLNFTLRILTFLFALVVLIQGLAQMGVPLATVLTGAGVTGFAIALAAQESLRNIFGSMMLLLDKPFKAGQRIKVQGHDGVVEGIGLRSTRIRTLAGHLASIPNEVVAKLDIENIGERPFIRRVFSVKIALDATPAEVDEALAIVRDVLAVKDGDEGEGNRCINDEELPPRVSLNEINADSLNILVMYWYHPPSYWDYLDHATWVNRELIRRFKDAGIDMALPAQALRLASDGKHAPASPSVETPPPEPGSQSQELDPEDVAPMESSLGDTGDK